MTFGFGDTEVAGDLGESSVRGRGQKVGRGEWRRESGHRG